MAKRKDRKGKGRGGGGGGGLMSLRSGFQRVVGTKKGPEKKRHPVWNVLSWILTIGLIGAAIFLVARRFL